MNIDELEDALSPPKEPERTLFPARAANVTPEEYRRKYLRPGAPLTEFIKGNISFNEFARRVYNG